jgi:hypothetical protein
VFPDTTLRPDIVNTLAHHRLDDPVWCLRILTSWIRP